MHFAKSSSKSCSRRSRGAHERGGGGTHAVREPGRTNDQRDVCRQFEVCHLPWSTEPHMQRTYFILVMRPCSCVDGRWNPGGTRKLLSLLRATMERKPWPCTMIIRLVRPLVRVISDSVCFRHLGSLVHIPAMEWLNHTAVHQELLSHPARGALAACWRGGPPPPPPPGQATHLGPRVMLTKLPALGAATCAHAHAPVSQ